MARYVVLVESWFTAPDGSAKLKRVGESVDINEQQAQYLLLSGQVAVPDGYTQPAVQPYTDGDVVTVTRDGRDYRLSGDDLASFFGPVVNGLTVGRVNGLSAALASKADKTSLSTVATTGQVVDLLLSSLPSTLPSQAGKLWNNGGLLSIS